MTTPAKPRNLFRKLWQSTRWSLQGLKIAFKVERSFRLEVYLLLVALPCAFWLGTQVWERMALIACIVAVLIVELLNSGLEAIVDKVSPEFHELAGRAKDFGSAAVFLALLHAAMVWAMVGIARFGS